MEERRTAISTPIFHRKTLLPVSHFTDEETKVGTLRISSTITPLVNKGPRIRSQAV
jgi:hypothetical protein